MKHKLTVKQLKDTVRDWPELDPYGEPSEVWVTTGICLSAQVLDIETLNLRTSKKGRHCDILLSTNL